jgi:hypothetical protein
MKTMEIMVKKIDKVQNTDIYCNITDAQNKLYFYSPYEELNFFIV